jgi:hypothetical protein
VRGRPAKIGQDAITHVAGDRPVAVRDYISRGSDTRAPASAAPRARAFHSPPSNPRDPVPAGSAVDLGADPEAAPDVGGADVVAGSLGLERLRLCPGGRGSMYRRLGTAACGCPDGGRAPPPAGPGSHRTGCRDRAGEGAAPRADVARPVSNELGYWPTGGGAASATPVRREETLRPANPWCRSPL